MDSVPSENSEKSENVNNILSARNYDDNSEKFHNSDGVNNVEYESNKNELKIGEKYQPKIANHKNKTKNEIYRNSINHQIELNEIGEFDFNMDNINSPLNDNNLKPAKKIFNFTFDENSFLPPTLNTPYLIKNHIVQYMEPIFKKAKKKSYLCCWA
ncbi:conserved Plasmodium protein, unknown function [Plasmodium berghei]|uniref:Uncharacterized protein n=2 Tax=Plasmodium berghei TaxID=5821 RepID=A0A509AK97_PLABA|nr:conserved Plasmodium protein, unknown function [Plasmodium berghei ANKA]CXI56757.1 conserved Plasmodium protein, unknown function [Plasmodium berghei]SCL95430.1 conserved Plasmodium protein, unknown function [Plasmodium berghei]SCM16254.1 conserved Plasmodium protein, unknown function [Plasmodium berghei]SCM18050.1 conserved Plasmodium protein, unknown function [Plasmodium berghei]SCN26494.1 conserved Plasmodium protein, unknown function [Plasmodium berghei]|eukprot:XP_034422178.1 conserved Plasmodium protein, unknown function [Plasmodium berghei ANKA]